MAEPAVEQIPMGDVADELTELHAEAKSIVSKLWSPAAYRELLDTATPAFDPALWRAIRELGWADVMVSEQQGGGGAGLSHLCVLTEVAGAAAAPIPLAAAASAGWCEDRSSSSSGLGMVLHEPAQLFDQAVSGCWPVVSYGLEATRVLVLAGQGDDCLLAAVDAAGAGVQREELRPLDHDPAARITMERAAMTVVDEGPPARQRHEQAMLRTQLATASELVGIAAASNEAAARYATIRVAFDKPIGAFQAIKHRLVDQRAAIEVARALVRRAANAVDRDEPDAIPLASLALFWAIDSLRGVPEGAIQVFGGIAYTWEHEAHCHLRRAACASSALGSRTHHRAVVAKWLQARRST